MIPTLYSQNETNFNHNGLGLLADTIYCYPDEIRNSSYELELAYPVFSDMYKELKANRWIKAKANDRFEAQLFRIYFISKPINGRITVKAEHISYLLKDNFIEILNYTGDCNGVLNALNAAATFTTGFTFNSNVIGNKNFNFDLRNFWDCVIGKDDSIISQFGTGIDIVRNNKNISLLINGGQDNNVLIAYKKNLTGFTCEENWTGCITKIYPYATKDNVRIILPEKYVDSKYINRDPSPRIVPIDFTSYFKDGENITVDVLRQKAIQYFIDTQCDIPNLNYNIEFVALSKTEEYKNFALNESIALLDYVIVRHELYGVDTKIKVINVKYDSLVERYLKLELGIIKNTITNLIKNTNKKIEQTDKKVDKTKKDVMQYTDDREGKIRVDFKAADDSIKGSVDDLASDESTHFEMTTKMISAAVESPDGGTTFIMRKDAIIQAIKDATGEHSSIFDATGQTIENGGFRILKSGSRVFWIEDDGYVAIKDLGLSDVALAKGSAFWHSLYHMPEIELLGKLICSGDVQINNLTVSSSKITIGGRTLDEIIDERISNSK